MEADKTLADLGWPQIMEAWAYRCRTERGAAAALASTPLSGVAAARKRVSETAEARMMEDKAQPMSFGGIADVRVAVVRAEKGSALEGEELVAISNSARGYHRLREQLEVQAEAAPLLWERAEGIEDFVDLYATLQRAFEPGGRLADTASRELGVLRRKVARLQQGLESKAKSMLDDSHIVEHLQDIYWTQREERYVLPVKASSRSRVPGVVHGSSGSGQTVFVEPHALVELNNELKLAEYAEKEEVLRILASLSARVGRDAEALRRASEISVGLDVIAGAANLANFLHARAPKFSDDEETIDLRRASHPLMLLSGKECIENDILMEEGRLLIISGPNAGGKTVALKTVGLAVLMSRYGLHIAAGEGSCLPWFDEVRAAIGDSQSLESELSTFSAHLVLLCEFLSEAGPRSLVLIDEICSATEPEQGGALAQAVLETLADRGTTALVTTHYERLKALASEDERFVNASVGFDLERMAPTFHLHLGVPGASAAIDVARRMGLPEFVNQRAEELAGGGRAQMDELLRIVTDERERLTDNRKALSEERAATAKAYEEARLMQAQAADDARREHEKNYDGAMEALRQARAELDRARKGIKKRIVVDASSIRADKNKVDALAQAVGKSAPKKTLPSGRAPTAEQLVVGARVTVLSLGNQGTVVDAPSKGVVQVQVGLMKTRVPLSDLRMAKAPKKKDESLRMRKSSVKNAVSRAVDEAMVRTPDATLDLRGERADDAIARVEQFLDSSILCARECVFIIHGHGTGALRSAVRAHLEGHHSVSKWRRGESTEGGDGVTVGWLRD
ncbi:MAG: endonuclease MutS2 [Myxococcales bacterium]|nr:endonuclease MutS2 [Myxococcales bacterium]